MRWFPRVLIPTVEKLLQRVDLGPRQRAFPFPHSVLPACLPVSPIPDTFIFDISKRSLNRNFGFIDIFVRRVILALFRKWRGHGRLTTIMEIRMPLSLTRRAIAPAWRCNKETVSRRLIGLPVKKAPGVGKGAPQNTYQLTDVLSRVKNPIHIGPLFRAATDDQNLHVGNGPDVMASAERLEAWLTPVMSQRYGAVKVRFMTGLANARGGVGYMPFLATLQLKLLLHSDVIKHVVMGTPNQLAWDSFSAAFALINSTYEPEAENLQVAA